MSANSPDALDITVVVPFYNPGAELERTIKGLASALDAEGKTFEIIAVSDGSTEPPPESIAGLEVAQLRIEALDTNRGKGAALRSGMSQGRGRYVGFIDADGDIPPGAMVDLAHVAAAGEPDAVLGTKHGVGRTGTPWSRRVGSAAWQVLVRTLFGLSVDSQTGVKLFRADVLREALPSTSLNGFAFDLELLVAIRSLGHTDLREVPITVNRRGASTVSFSTATRMLVDLWTIFWRTKVGRQTTAAVAVPTRTVSLSGAELDES